jgi:hypothetical protein
MRINRWIILPLLFAVSITIPAFFFTDRLTSGQILFKLCWGAVCGLALAAWNDIRARQRSGITDEEIYKVRQSRFVTVAGSIEKALELCREAATSIEGLKLRSVNEATKEVIARSRLKWETFGNVITMRASRVGENLTEIQITTRPILPTIIVDYGSAWEEANEVAKYLRNHDANINPKHLEEGMEILNTASVRPIGKIFEI